MMFTPPTPQDKTGLSRPGRRCEQAIIVTNCRSPVSDAVVATDISTGWAKKSDCF